MVVISARDQRVRLGVLAIFRVSISFEISSQKIASEKNQTNREQAGECNEREGPKNLNRKHRAGEYQNQSDQRRFLDERAFKSFFIGTRALASADPNRSAIRIDDRIQISSNPAKREEASTDSNTGQLEQAHNRYKMDDSLDVLTIVDGSHAGNQCKQCCDPGAPFRPRFVMALRQILNTGDDTILTVCVTFYTMITSLA